MKKDTLYLIIALLSLYIAWRSYSMNKRHIGKTKQKTEPVTEKANDEKEHIVPDPNHHTPLKLSSFEDCPYCGTHNAEVTRTQFADGTMRITEVVCPNKSCPGHGTKPTDKKFDVEGTADNDPNVSRKFVTTQSARQ